MSLSAKEKANKYAFLKMQPPPGYVAGLGRGASGFTTRSDIGPARELGAMVDPATAGKAVDSGYGSAQGGMRTEDAEEQTEDTGQYQDPENETGLFAGVPYEADDAEADRIYEGVDKQMGQRRAKIKEAREKEEEEEFRRNNPRISERFSDLKRSLSTVTNSEWENLPEVGNLTGKRRKHNLRELREQRAFVVPDSVIVGSRDKNAVENSLDAQQMTDGLETPADGTMTDFREIGQAQKQVLSLRLDAQAGKDSVSGQTTIDPKGYLTDLNSIVIKSEAEIGDLKRGRTLLGSLTKTNPKHGPGWIAAARLEEVAGKMVAARKIIAEGCKMCPTSDEVWREAARLNTPENAKVILAEAVKHIPTSVNIWLEAADLEQEPQMKKRVLRKALEYIVRRRSDGVALTSSAELGQAMAEDRQPRGRPRQREDPAPASDRGRAVVDRALARIGPRRDARERQEGAQQRPQGRTDLARAAHRRCSSDRAGHQAGRRGQGSG